MRPDIGDSPDRCGSEEVSARRSIPARIPARYSFWPKEADTQLDRKSLQTQWPRWELNPHARFRAADFKARLQGHSRSTARGRRGCCGSKWDQAGSERVPVGRPAEQPAGRPGPHSGPPEVPFLGRCGGLPEWQRLGLNSFLAGAWDRLGGRPPAHHPQLANRPSGQEPLSARRSHDPQRRRRCQVMKGNTKTPHPVARGLATSLFSCSSWSRSVNIPQTKRSDNQRYPIPPVRPR